MVAIALHKVYVVYRGVEMVACDEINYLHSKSNI